MDDTYFDGEIKRLILERAPELKAQPRRTQHGICHLMYMLATGQGYRHCYDESGYFVSYSYLREMFPSNTGEFARLSEELGLFEISHNWYWKKGHGKVTKPTNKTLIIIEEVIHMRKIKLESGKRVILVDINGQRLRKPKAAIDAYDSEGKRRKTEGQLLSSTINIDLECLSPMLEEVDHAIKNVDKPSRLDRGKLLSADERNRRLEKHKEQILICEFHANLDNLEPGEMLNRYRETGSGRLAGQDFHLQRVRREIREGLFAGYYDYDIANCHYTILHQLGTRYGCPMHSTTCYLDNKTRFRRDLCKEYGLTEDQIKKIMLAMLYGAPLTTSTFGSIGREIIDADARAFVEHYDVVAIHKEIKQAKRVVLNNARKWGGTVVNVLGKRCPITEKDDTLLAHILQGYEALAIDIAILGLDGDITLLCFDGFITNWQIDTKPFEAAFFERTGLEIVYESTLLGSETG